MVQTGGVLCLQVHPRLCCESHSNEAQCGMYGQPWWVDLGGPWIPSTGRGWLGGGGVLQSLPACPQTRCLWLWLADPKFDVLQL